MILSLARSLWSSLGLSGRVIATILVPLLPWGLVRGDTGEWLCHRGSPTQDGRALIKGRITQPHILWKHYVGQIESVVIVDPVPVDSTVDVPLSNLTDGSLDAKDPRWGFVPPEVDLEGRRQNVGNTTTTIYADVLPDVGGLEKIEFESGFGLPTVNGNWQPAVGRCFAWKNGAWVKVWQTDPIPMLFVPLPIAGDFDSDGQPEVAILPWKELLILDARTGRIKDRCPFTEGRSYGLLGVYDLDADGSSDFVVQADFAKHVDVLGYRDGKLKVLWQRSIEPDISNPRKILHVHPTSAADVDGDGRLEVFVNLYDDTGDHRWHLTVHHGTTGQVIADMADEYLQGVVDIDGDGVSELLTCRTTEQAVPEHGTIRVRAIRRGQVTTMWEYPNAAWQLWDPPLPSNVNSGATLPQRTVLCRNVRGRTAVVVRQPASGQPDEIVALCLRWGDGKFRLSSSLRGPRLQAIGLDSDGRLLVRTFTSPNTSSRLTLTRGTGRVVHSRQTGTTPSSPVVCFPKGADRPCVIVQGYGEELVVVQGGKDGAAPTEVRRFVGRGQASQWPASLGAVAADLQGNGGRQVIYATQAPSGCARLVVRDAGGQETWHHDFATLPGGAPIWNVGGVILWQAGHFTHASQQDVLVTIRRSMMHSEETLLLSGRDGTEVWRRDRQISQRGVGGIPFAVSDFDGDGLDDAASFHPSLFYILKGSTGKDIIAMDATWKDVPIRPVYWGLPVAGRFEDSPRASVLMAGATMTALIRADGTCIWHDAIEKSPRDFAFGDFDGDGRVEVMGLGYEDGIRCYRASDGKVAWRIANPAKGPLSGTASADLNSDGRDEALGVSGTSLFCLGMASEGEGKLLWKLDLPVNAGPPSVADVDGSGVATILLVGDDGCLYAIR